MVRVPTAGRVSKGLRVLRFICAVECRTDAFVEEEAQHVGVRVPAQGISRQTHERCRVKSQSNCHCNVSTTTYIAARLIALQPYNRVIRVMT
jgi:hypothetical protein